MPFKKQNNEVWVVVRLTRTIRRCGHDTIYSSREVIRKYLESFRDYDIEDAILAEFNGDEAWDIMWKCIPSRLGEKLQKKMEDLYAM